MVKLARLADDSGGTRRLRPGGKRRLFLSSPVSTVRLTHARRPNEKRKKVAADEINIRSESPSERNRVLEINFKSLSAQGNYLAKTAC